METKPVFSKQDLAEIEILKGMETEALLKSLDDCMEIYRNRDVVSVPVPDLEKRLIVTVKILTAILKDRGEGIH